MDVPGLNPAEITDEQLVDRMNQLRFNASKVQHHPQLYNSVVMILDALEAEYQDRMERRRYDEEQEKRRQNKVSDHIEIGSLDTDKKEQE